MITERSNDTSKTIRNDRFIKCSKCNVNIPQEDVAKYKKCTICNAEWDPAIQVSAQNMDDRKEGEVKKTSKTRKRWVILTSKQGKEYYHNTETGHDQWHKPADFDAEAEDVKFGT